MGIESRDTAALPTPIFLLSLPRSGSTLLQRMMAAHPDITTTAEPNILFYPLLSLEKEGLYSLADHVYFQSAINEFAERLPGGKSSYLHELGNFARKLYANSMTTPVRYFLDKSPYYCFIAPGLFQLFDEAKFVFLWRHPLAAAASMLNFPGTNPQQWSLYKYPHTFDGLASLIHAYQVNQNSAFAIRYEDLVRSPQEILAKLLDYLELSNETDLSSEFHKVQFAGKHYDPNAKLAEFQTVRNDRHDEWQKFFSNPLRKRWARHYVEWIGQERLALMGYDLDNILDELNATPATLNLVANDAYWMSFGFFFRLFNGRMLRNNVRRWRAREKFWGYR